MAKQMIFFSYSRNDAQTAIRIATELKKAGGNVWIDQLDIKIGAIWDIEIEKALESCDCVLFLMSQASVASDNVLNEVYYAVDEKKRVLPVKINTCKIPFRITRLQYIDLSSDYEAGFNNLLLALSLHEWQPEQTYFAKEKNLNHVSIEEDKIWQHVQNENTKTAYDDYINSFPAGKYRDVAMEAINNLNDQEEKQIQIKNEEVLWNDTAKRNTSNSYANYLKVSKLGKYEVEAKKRILEIKEEVHWQSAKDQNTVAGYQNYLREFNNGKHQDQAKKTMKELELQEKNKHFEEHSYGSESHQQKETQEGGRQHEKPTDLVEKVADKSTIPKKYFKIIIAGLLGIALVSITVISFNKTSSQSSKKRDADSLFKAGYEYLKKQQKSEALLAFTKAADAGSDSSMNLLGWMYETGYGASVDHSKAAEWYTKAADLGNVQALVRLGMMYQIGRGIKLDSTKTFELFQKAAETGDPEGMVCLGWTYSAGFGVKKDVSKAVSLYYKGAEAGSPHGWYNLAYLYSVGEGVVKNEVMALELTKKAAQGGDPAGMTALGALYRSGDLGCIIDHKKAVEWFRKGAEAGDVNGMAGLAHMYSYGFGVEQNDSIAREWHEKAKAAGYKE